jgi:phage terminase small subunit
VDKNMPVKEAKPRELTPKERVFVVEYVACRNATKAAIRAKYSKKSARQLAARMLSKDYIKAAINEKIKKIEEKTLITVEEVINGLKKIAFVDIRQAFDDKGDLLPIHEIPDDVAAAIGGVDVEAIFDYVKVKPKGAEKIARARECTGYTKKVKMTEKTAALIALGRHLKMFTDKVEVEVVDKLAERMSEARKRVNNAKR